MASAALALVSCNKENAVVPVQPDENAAEAVETVAAVMDQPLTKSDYTISGSTASFEWTSGDRFFRLVRKYGDTEGTYSNYDHYSYSAGTIDGALATFSGSPVGSAYEDTGYALYPAGLSNGANFSHSSGTNVLTFTLNEKLTYDASAPLKNIIPMVGKYSEDKYSFKPVVGVIGISAKNIPAEATSISVSSTSGGFSGTTVTMTSKTDASYVKSLDDLVGPSSAGLRSSWFGSGTAKTFTFENLDPEQTYKFYFPTPVGTYSNLTITLKAGDTVLGTVNASGFSLNVTRANIVDIAAVIDFSKVKKYTLDDILGSYIMITTAGAYSSNSTAGALVLEASDDASKGNVMMTKFAGVSGKQYGTFDGLAITFPKDQIFGANPYSDAATKPYVALDFYKSEVVDAVFQVLGKGKIQAVGADAMGLRTCTEADWQSYGGGWPWALCFGSIYAEWGTSRTQVSLTESMVAPVASETTEGSVAGLVDGDTGTYWHSPWSVAGTYDSTYGVYIDIDLGEGNGVKNFDVLFCLRNCLNDHPDHVKIYASSDGASWGAAIGELSSIYSTVGAGNWTAPIVCEASAKSRYIRLSILSTNGSNGGVSALTSSGCTHMAELQVWSRD